MERFATEMTGCMEATIADWPQLRWLRVCPGASTAVFYKGLPEPISKDWDMPSKRNWIAAFAAILALNIASVSSAPAEESLADGARKAGRAVGTAAREVWQEGKKVGKEIGHGVAKVGKEIGHGAAKAGKAVGGAAKEGAREFKRAIKGEK